MVTNDPFGEADFAIDEVVQPLSLEHLYFPGLIGFVQLANLFVVLHQGLANDCIKVGFESSSPFTKRPRVMGSDAVNCQ
jgi:hypothetical protein